MLLELDELFCDDEELALLVDEEELFVEDELFADELFVELALFVLLPELNDFEEGRPLLEELTVDPVELSLPLLWAGMCGQIIP